MIAATVLPALPAAAEDVPTPDPVVTSQPTTDPAPESTPTADPTPESTPSSEPTSDPTPTADPTPAAVTPVDSTVTYGGILNRIADESKDSAAPTLVLSVTGQGYLLVDASELPQANRGGKINATIAVPAGLTLSSNADNRFTQLATYSTSVAPLKLVATAAQRGAPKQTTGQLVTVTPVANATHKVYVVLVSPKEKATKASNQTATEAATLVQHADDYWNAQSSGSIDFALAGTVPWYKSKYSCKTDSGSTALWNQAASAAKSKLGYVEGPNTHLVLLFPATTNCGGAIGLGTIGWSVNQGGVIWVVGGTNIEIREATLAHELGHNLSLGHADYLACNSASPVVGSNTAFYASNNGPAGVTGCTVEPYGDLTDVMGYGQDELTGGALSSPNAIRSGIWPSSAWVQAAPGTNSYVINAVGSNTGQRAVVVQDDDGVNYFVEYRNFQGDDAQYNAQGCDVDACVSATANTPGIRVLRMEPSGYNDHGAIYSGYQGLPGYDAYLIGRTTGEKVRYLVGDNFYSKAGSAGIRVQVTAIGANNATVSITRAVHVNTNDYVYVESTRYYDATYRVGDTLTAFLGDDWDAETNAYVWQRSDASASGYVNIPTATGSSYTLTAADLNKYIRVTVTGSSPGQPNATSTGWPGVNQNDGAPAKIAAGIYLTTDPGTVVIDNSTGTVKALDSNFPATHTAFQYQWYRGSTKIAAPAGTDQFYNLTPADADQTLKVTVTTTIPGYSNSVVRSDTANLTIQTSSPPAALTIAGTPKVGTQVTVDTSGLAWFDVDGNSLSGVTPSYQWLRNGVAIAGSDATDDADYTLQGVDYNAKITLRVTAAKPGFVSKAVTTAAFKPTQLGTFTHNQDVSITSTGLSKKANAAPNDVSPFFAGTVVSYQWTRDGVAISGATHDTYVLKDADYGKTVRAKVSYSLPGYATFTQDDVNGAGRYWIRANAVLPQITGTPFVGATLGIAPRTYFDMMTPGTSGFTIPNGMITRDIQWYRNGVAIPVGDGGKGLTYGVVAADKGKKLTVKMTVTASGYEYDLPSVSTSVATPTIGSAQIPNADIAPMPTLVAMDTSTAFATVVGFSIDGGTTTGTTGLTSPGGPANTVAYQWFRDDAAISGATKVTYPLTQADRGHLISIRITTSHAAVGSTTYTTDIRYSVAHDFTLTSTAIGSIIDTVPNTDPLAVGSSVDAGLPSLEDADHNNVLGTSRTKQWYRGSVAISAAQGGVNVNNTPYVLQPADAGSTISVKMTIGKVGYIPLTITETTGNPATTVAKGTLVGMPTATVTINNPATNELLATAGGTVTGVGGSPAATFTYQWLRNGVDIAGQTKTTYKLVAADAGNNIKVRVTANLAGYTSVPVESTPINYSILTVSGHPPRSTGNTWGVGTGIQVVDDQFTDASLVNLTPDNVKYEWLRKIGSTTKVVATTTYPNYTLQAADLGGSFTVRLTVTKAGYIPLVFTTAPISQVVVKGTDTDTWFPVAQSNSIGVLTAAISDLEPLSPAPTFKYKWFRNGVAISGATGKTYKLVAADSTKKIKVQVTMTRAGFNPLTTPTKTSAEVEPTIYVGATGPTITPLTTVSVGGDLQAHPPVFYDDAALTNASSGLTYSYTWYRGGSVISGAKTDIYELTSSDKGKVITVKATVTGPGRLAKTSAASAPTTSVIAGTIVLGSYQAVVTLTGTSTKTAKVTFTGTPDVPGSNGLTPTYKWQRNGSTISGQTKSSYKLTSSDTGKLVTVLVTLTKSGFTSLPLPVLTANAVIPSEDAPIQIAGSNVSTAHAGETLNVIAALYYLQDQYPGGSNLPSSAESIQWYANDVAIPGAVGASYVLPGDIATNTVVTAKIKVIGGTYYNTFVHVSLPVTIN